MIDWLMDRLIESGPNGSSVLIDFVFFIRLHSPLGALQQKEFHARVHGFFESCAHRKHIT